MAVSGVFRGFPRKVHTHKEQDRQGYEQGATHKQTEHISTKNILLTSKGSRPFSGAPRGGGRAPAPTERISNLLTWGLLMGPVAAVSPFGDEKGEGRVRENISKTTKASCQTMKGKFCMSYELSRACAVCYFATVAHSSAQNIPLRPGVLRVSRTVFVGCRVSQEFVGVLGI